MGPFYPSLRRWHCRERDKVATLGPMSPYWLLTIYCFFIVFASLAGGVVTHWVRLTHVRLQVAMSFVGGAMLGVGLLNLLPHAIYEWEPNVNAPVYCLLGGFLFMFFMERVFHFHHHDAPADTAPNCDHEHHAGHDHHHGQGQAPMRLTWQAAFAGLALHSALDGMALAASVRAEAEENVGLAGIVVFAVIALHKPFDSLTLGTLMAVAGRSSGMRHLVNALYATAVPLGACAYNLVAEQTMAEGWHVTGSVLAFAAGAFLCIATSDLLPELQFHSHDRVVLSAALIAGVALAALLAYFEERGHSHHEGHGHSHSASEPLSGRFDRALTRVAFAQHVENERHRSDRADRHECPAHGFALLVRQTVGQQ
ncbi:MAG TPA: ZIP family metal transporter [Pirellulales bacterium]|nr:ZIP family metal transporter [Pirellulales bacterium]